MPVWYAAYGSNLLRSRLDCYLVGGAAPGSSHIDPGARDPSPPQGDEGVTLSGTLWFASHSAGWGGAVAFYDPSTPGPALGRAYLLTAGQLADVMAQELGLRPGALDVPALPTADGRLAVTDGRYGTLVGCGELAGHPVVTLTAGWAVGDVSPAAPSLAYLRTIARGLAEAHGLAPAGAAAYLTGCTGVAGVWTTRELTAALGPG